ncbi:hypothetical protein [Streptomyces sp. NPDC048419]|uniref:hypothetical protein n=1 Tax=Streptomyces sp. NPDC048419 TaxID=3365547 RepID=UPI003724524D
MVDDIHINMNPEDLAEGLLAIAGAAHLRAVHTCLPYENSRSRLLPISAVRAVAVASAEKQASPLSPDGYGLLLAEDETGRKETLLAGDVEYVRALSVAGAETLSDLALPSDKFLIRDGWSDDWR